MFTITGFRSWNLNADNLDEAVKFYRDLLGAEVAHTHTVRGVNVVRVRLGSTTIGLFDASERPSPGVPHHTFDFVGASDPEALQKEFEAKGIKVEGIRMHGDGPGYSIYINDPSGNRLELSTDPA